MWIDKEDLTLREYNSLCPTYGLFDEVNFENIKYYKDDNGQVWEVSFCIDGSLNKRMRELERLQKITELAKGLDLL